MSNCPLTSSAQNTLRNKENRSQQAFIDAQTSLSLLTVFVLAMALSSDILPQTLSFCLCPRVH